MTDTSQTCQICQNHFTEHESVPLKLIRPSILELIRKEHPDCDMSGVICKPDLDAYRIKYINHLISIDKDTISEQEKQVIKSLEKWQLLSRDLNKEFSDKSTIGQRIADRVANFGGSWKFIIFFFIITGSWVVLNAVYLLFVPFDPFPYILLNLVLGFMAAMQAPIIMMSQNRQEAKDRLRSEHDYRVNLKSELEIRMLDEKVDHLLLSQWQRLLEIQQLQIDLMNETNSKLDAMGTGKA